MPEQNVIIVGGVGSIDTSATLNGNVAGQNEYTGHLAAVVDENTGLLSGTLADNSELIGVSVRNGSLSAINQVNGATGASLSLRPGIDGADGKDGFSPTITVHKDTPTEYVLKITNKDGSYFTPNLYPDIEGLQDVAALVASKVDEDLAEYPVIDPNLLTIQQRESSFLYTRTLDVNRKIALSEVALEKEVNEKIRTKLQTVAQVPLADEWRVGDYILLDYIPTDK